MTCDLKEEKQRERMRELITRSSQRKLMLHYSNSRTAYALAGLKKRGYGWRSLAKFFAIVMGMMLLSAMLWRIPSGMSSTESPLPSLNSALPLQGMASWYSTEACRSNSNPSCPTASGRSLYALEKGPHYFAAVFEKIPFKTKLRVTNIQNGKSVVVLVLDRGPHPRLKRAIDLSRSAFQKIAKRSKGLIKVRIERVP